MPKPTRRERRKLAEQGKLQRRPAPPVEERAAPAAPRERERERPTSARPSAVRAASSAPAARRATMPSGDPNEYAYVKADLMRILVLGGGLIGIMVALKFVLPQ